MITTAPASPRPGTSPTAPNPAPPSSPPATSHPRADARLARPEAGRHRPPAVPGQVSPAWPGTRDRRAGCPAPLAPACAAPDPPAAAPGRAVPRRQADAVPGPSGVRGPARHRHLLPVVPAPVASDTQGAGADPGGTGLRGGRNLPLDRT